MPRMGVPRAAILGDDEEHDAGPGRTTSQHLDTTAFRRSSTTTAWQRVESALLAKSRKQKEITDRVVDLGDVLRDVTEFWGWTELGYFMIYFLLGILALFMHWNLTLPVMKSNVQQTFLGFGDPPAGAGHQLASVTSMWDGVTYLSDYANNFIAGSESRKLPNNQIQIDDYATVRYMRISAALQKNCDYSQLLCYLDPASGATFNTKGRWAPVDNIPGVDLGPMMVADIVSSSILYRNASLTILSDIAADFAYVSKYSYFLSLDMVLENQLSTNDLVYVSLQVTRTMGMFDGPDQKITKASVTYSLSTGLYTTPQAKARIAIEILFIAMNLFYLAREADIAYIAYQQFGFRGVTRYLTAAWTIINLVGFILTGGWCWWYVSLMIQDFHHDHDPPMDAASVNNAVDFGQSLQLWMFVGIISNLCLGVRMLKSMDLHASLRIYARVLIHTWSTLRDFLVFFFYLLLLLGTASLAFFQISGGNPAFVTVQDAIQSMALLTFGFLDWSSFRNEGLGLGGWQPTIVLLFWVIVIGLILISQNIILSIVVLAYEQAKRSEPVVECSIFTLLGHRFAFDLSRMAYRLRMIPRDIFVEDTVNAFHHALYLHGIGQLSEGLFGCYLAARWAICLEDEVVLLSRFFTDYAIQASVKQSRWDDTFRSFQPVTNPNLLRSFGHLLNKVQGSDEVLEGVVAAAGASEGADRDSLLAETQSGPGFARPRNGLNSMLKSLARSSTHGLEVSQAGTSRKHLWGLRPSKVTPFETLPGETTTSGPRVLASCEHPLSFESLLSLMTVVIPSNQRFVHAQHLHHRPLCKFSAARLPRAADFIMRVYSFPRVATKGAHPTEPPPVLERRKSSVKGLPQPSGEPAQVASSDTVPPKPKAGMASLLGKIKAARSEASLSADVPVLGEDVSGEGSNSSGAQVPAAGSKDSPSYEAVQLLDVDESDVVHEGVSELKPSKSKKSGAGGKKKKKSRKSPVDGDPPAEGGQYE